MEGKPILEHVRSLFGKITSPLPVKRILIEANIVLEPDVAIGVIIIRSRICRLRRRLGIVCIMSPVIDIAVGSRLVRLVRSMHLLF